MGFMVMLKKDFEKKLDRRMKNWKQEQHEKKIFGDPEKEDVVWKIVPLTGGGFIRKPFKKEYMDYSGAFETDVVEELSESEKMQNELEPIYHPTEYDESDEIEAEKRAEKHFKQPPQPSYRFQEGEKWVSIKDGEMVFEDIEIKDA